ncbi:hypothetical protein D9619_000284 [Psilocybe cf. subviscida]|uniref:Uncharacterized protein n=1 Tax=Psilocybe cf. subviscida TaxID=2480587 RepID=A0A8H5F2T6_9AGAR|nr:hypothetical protein D9619_000284 [Psilocybe cf. subviscida]
MDDFNPTSCKLQPGTVVGVWVSQYKITSALAACSTSTYGFNIALAITCVRLLLTHREPNTSRRKQIITCLYIAVMIGFASHAVVDANTTLDGGVIDSLRNTENPQRLLSAIFSPPMPVSLPLAVWGADAVLICRCVILYHLVSLRRKILLYAFLGIGAVSSIGSGIAAYYLGFALRFSGYSQVVISGVTPCTIGVNGAVAFLIAARLIYAQRLLSKFQHEKQDNEPRPYMTALAICVESSVLILLVAVASVIRQDAIVLMPQISVLSPLLIVYRVLQGRAEKTITRLEDTLQFHHTQNSSVVVS